MAQPLRLNRDDVEAELCRRSLPDFIAKAWPLVEPDVPLSWNWHLDALCGLLAEVSAGAVKRAVITIPPGCSKSLTVSVFWPAWEWASNPGLRYLTASYGAHLSVRDNLRLRTIVTSPWYQRHYALRLSGDQNSKVRFDTTASGWRIATSVGGVGTGEHPERVICLDGDSAVTTDEGPLSIRNIVEGRLPVRVLGSGGRWQSIRKYERGCGRPMLEIETAGGARLRCTEDHPVYVEGRGFVRASILLESRDGNLHMRPLRSTIQPTASARGPEQAGRSLLLPSLPRPGNDGGCPPALDAGLQAVRALWSAHRWLSERVAVAALLFQAMRESARDCAEDAGVSGLPRFVLCLGPGAGSLQQGLRWRDAPNDDSRDWQRALQARGLGDGIRSGVHQEAAQRNSSSRWGVRGLLGGRWSSPGPPHRRLEEQSCAAELGDHVQQLPSQGPHQDRNSRDLDAGTRVVAVRRCETPVAVYNIQTWPDHDYFAEGFLVHNCDDPATAEQARSELERERVRDWFDRTISSRGIVRDVRTVVIAQRLHEDDLPGHLIAKGGWEHLCLPMRFEPGRVDRRDPRTEAGELLWPGLFTEDRVRQLENDLGPYGSASQLQQRPAPEGGGLFKRAKVKYVRAAPVVARRCRGWDTAATESGGDWTSGPRLALSPDGSICIEDVRRGQLGPDGVNALMLATAQADGRACMQREEREPGGAGKAVIAARVKLLAGYDYAEVIVSGDKVTRANPFRAQWDAGNVSILVPDPDNPPPWVEPYLQVMESFPTGRYDDDVDGTSTAYNALVAEPKHEGGAVPMTRSGAQGNFIRR